MLLVPSLGTRLSKRVTAAALRSKAEFQSGAILWLYGTVELSCETRQRYNRKLRLK
jgi:hypothetical protein